MTVLPGHLTVASDRDLTFVADDQNCGAVHHILVSI
jgi:hypothetical protein